MTDVLMSTWTVYDHPADYPNSYVARRFEVIPGQLEPRRTNDLYLARDIEQMNQHFERLGLAFLSRFEADEPQIMGVWM